MASSPKTEEIPNASAAGPSVPKSWLSLFGQLYPLLSPREEQIPDQPPNSIFGARLCVALRYTAVSISLAKENGEQYVWGYIPALVAKCGLYLKQRGIDVEGVFRVGGSEKRMRDLQDIFNTPPNVRLLQAHFSMARKSIGRHLLCTTWLACSAATLYFCRCVQQQH